MSGTHPGADRSCCLKYLTCLIAAGGFLLNSGKNTWKRLRGGPAVPKAAEGEGALQNSCPVFHDGEWEACFGRSLCDDLTETAT